MNPQNRRYNSDQEAERGQEALAAAKHLLQGGFFNDAITRAYYAAYHLARALLFRLGLEPKTHKGVIQLFSLHYVKTGVIEREVADYLARLETDRELSDYNAGARFTGEEARSRISEAEQFMMACREVLGRGPS